MTAENKVSVSAGKLILSLPEAESPVVWQMALDTAQASAFTISEDKKKKIFSLVSKDQDGKESAIADFKKKEDAVGVLMQTSEVLQNGGDAANANDPVSKASSGHGEKNDKSDKYGALIAFLLIVALFGVWMISASMNPEDVTYANSLGGIQSEGGVPARDSSGVPVSVDDFLSNQ